MAQRGALSSDEVNLLIYRHLLEAGFTHAAFVFACESNVSKVDVNAKEVPFGALVSFIQKGFMYMELEANLTEDGADVYGDFTPISARDLLTKDTKELRQAVREMKLQGGDAGGSGPAAMDVGGHKDPDAEAAAPQQRQLHGHTGELHALTWSAAAGMLASASADGTVRMWDVASGSSVTCTAPSGGASAGMVTAVEWAPDGQALAGASSSGTVLIWGRDGALRSTLHGHEAVTVSLRWSPRGDLLASGAADGSAVVWDARAGTQRQRWVLPGGCAYDLDWRSNAVLAAGMEDGSVPVLKLGVEQPLRVGRDHAAAAAAAGNPSSAEVNEVRWDPTGKVLASASNDMTVRLWAAAGDAPARVLRGHKREVMALAWAPGGDVKGAPPPLLATGSLDGSVRLWDVEQGACVGVLDQHQGGILCLCWSKDGALLAAGDGDGNVTAWAVRPGGRGGTAVAALKGKGQARAVAVQWVDGGAVALGTGLAAAFEGSPALTLAELS